MKIDLEEFDGVALLEDCPEHGLVRGQIGTVVMLHSGQHYEIEFCDHDGQTYALVALPANRLLRIHRDPPRERLN